MATRDFSPLRRPAPGELAAFLTRLHIPNVAVMRWAARVGGAASWAAPKTA